MPIDLGAPSGKHADGDADRTDSIPHPARPRPQSQLSEAPRDPRDDIGVGAFQATTSRPASPYTLNPPIDFDGLSWPSEFCRHDW